MSKESDEYGTPLWFYDELNKRFYFVLDPCAKPSNDLGLPFYYTKAMDGLTKSWQCFRGGPAFMNPPYSQMKLWAKKAYEESTRGTLVVGLVRHDPSTKWWNNWVRDKALVWPVPYRLKFVGGEGSYNFPNAVVIWHGMEAFRK